ncbi:MAG: hypothetical protein ACE5Q6_04580 [Dehalococcoidia bacterium]
MRAERKLTVADILNRISQDNIAKVLHTLGQDSKGTKRLLIQRLLSQHYGTSELLDKFTSADLNRAAGELGIPKSRSKAETVHQLSSLVEEVSLVRMLLNGLFWMIVFGLLISISQVFGIIHEVISLVIGIILFLTGLYTLFFAWLWDTEQERRYLKQINPVTWFEDATIMVMLGIGVTILFGFVCEDLHSLTDIAFAVPPSPDFLHWIIFAFDNLFEAALLDFPNIYDLQGSPIEVGSFWSRTLVFSFRVAIDLIIIRTMINHFGIVRKGLNRRAEVLRNIRWRRLSS